MRLIDADARVTVQSFDAMNEEYGHEEMTVEQALDFATDEGCPPTIDAIPVEWLKQYAPEKWSMYMQAAAEIIIETWQKEQEAQDAGAQTTQN